MAKINRNMLLLNGAAAIVVVASVALAVRSHFTTEEIETCRARFETGVQWSFERDDGAGGLMSAFDLQSRLGGTDWGLAERVEVVRVTDGPTKGALQIDLGKQVASQDAQTPRPGVGFLWAPASLERPKSACLSYAVFIPKAFDFGSGGRLPGFVGGAQGETLNGPTAFSTRLAWTEKGHLDVYGSIPGSTKGRGIATKDRPPELPRGRWVTLDQEIVLNTPGTRNGIFRMWMDGQLVLQSSTVGYRAKPNVELSAVLGEVTYAGTPLKSRKNAKLWMTPFEVRWQ